MPKVHRGMIWSMHIWNIIRQSKGSFPTKRIAYWKLIWLIVTMLEEQVVLIAVGNGYVIFWKYLYICVQRTWIFHIPIKHRLTITAMNALSTYNKKSNNKISTRILLTEWGRRGASTNSLIDRSLIKSKSHGDDDPMAMTIPWLLRLGIRMAMISSTQYDTRIGEI